MFYSFLPGFYFPAMAGGAEGGDGGFISLVVMMAVIFAIFYFLVIRPQKKEQQKHSNMLSRIKKGDRVVTAGGIHGQVSSVSDNTLKLNVARDIKITVNKNSIMHVRGADSGENEVDEE